MAHRTIEYMRLRDLQPAPKNPKAHDLNLLRRSMDRFGFVEPPILDERTGRLLAGHGRMETLAAAEVAGISPPDGIQVDDEGHWLLPVVRGVHTADDAEAEALLVVLNQATIAAGWQPAPLADLLAERVETHGDEWLDGTGIGRPDLDGLLASLGREVPVSPHTRTIGADEPEPPLPLVPENPVTQRGDVWIVGRHRIMCGDCRNADDVATLIDGATVNLAVTSPPYADRREYDESSGFQPIPPDEYVDWFDAVQAQVAAHLAEDGSWLVNIKAGAEGLDTELYVMDLVAAHVRRWNWHWATEFVWERNGVPKAPVLRLKNQHEPVYQFAKARWKFRPENVMHPSENVPMSLGPGSGNTSWKDRQGNGGVIPADRRKHASGTFTRHQGKGGDEGGEIFATERGAGMAFPGNRVPAEGARPRRDNHSTKSLPEMQGLGGDVGTHLVEGMAYPGNRLPTFISTHEATGHTAAYPVGLPAWFVRLFTDEGDAIYDPFVGSGSTILAAEQEARVGYGMELSPAYVDVALARIQRRTGLVPVLARTGEAHDFTPAETPAG